MKSISIFTLLHLSIRKHITVDTTWIEEKRACISRSYINNYNSTRLFRKEYLLTFSFSTLENNNEEKPRRPRSINPHDHLASSSSITRRRSRLTKIHLPKRGKKNWLLLPMLIRSEANFVSRLPLIGPSVARLRISKRLSLRPFPPPAHPSPAGENSWLVRGEGK